jgi:hypothetical protein
MLKAEYDRIKASVTGIEYKARHILVEKETEAKDIIARLKKDPGAFEKLAADRSKDQGSKARGGDLGWFDTKRMVPEFGAAVAKLEKGKFTETPVKTVRLSRHPAGRHEADRGASAGRRQTPAHPTAPAAKLGEAHGCLKPRPRSRLPVPLRRLHQRRLRRHRNKRSVSATLANVEPRLGQHISEWWRRSAWRKRPLLARHTGCPVDAVFLTDEGSHDLLGCCVSGHRTGCSFSRLFRNSRPVDEHRVDSIYRRPDTGRHLFRRWTPPACIEGPL